MTLKMLHLNLVRLQNVFVDESLLTFVDVLAE